MYASPELGNSKQQWFTVSSKFDDKIFCDMTRPVAVLTLSESADAARIEAACEAGYESEDIPRLHGSWKDVPELIKIQHRKIVRTMLKSIGVITA